MVKSKNRKHNPPTLQQRHHSKIKSATQPTKTSVNPSSATTKASSKTKGSKSLPPTIPFEPDDRILLIGEGDFSFARSLVEHHHCFDVTATCFDGQTELFSKYSPQVDENIEYLTDSDQAVLYNVDATRLDAAKSPLAKHIGANATSRSKQTKPDPKRNDPGSQSKTSSVGAASQHQQDRPAQDLGYYNRIIFNFPHTGGKSTDVNRQVRFNQELLVNFFHSAISLLQKSPAATGNNPKQEQQKSATSSSSATPTIIVTLFEGEPYTLWNIRDLARHAGLIVLRSFRFQADAYPGYRHARTLGNLEGSEDGRGAWKGEEREARSYVFAKKEG